MKTRIYLTIDIDETVWAAEYGLASPDQAAEDINGSLRESINSGALIDLIRANWPMLRDMAALSVTGPHATADDVIDYTWTALSDDAKERAVELLADREAQRPWDSYDIDRIRETLVFALADQLGTPEREQWGSGDFPGIPNIKIEEWDLERGQSLTVSGTLDRDNAPDLPWTDSMDDVVMGGGRRGYPMIDVRERETGSGEIPEDEMAAMELAVKTALHGALKASVAESEYMASVEAARERAENDDVQRYTASGELV